MSVGRLVGWVKFLFMPKIISLSVEFMWFMCLVRFVSYSFIAFLLLTFFFKKVFLDVLSITKKDYHFWLAIKFKIKNKNVSTQCMLTVLRIWPWNSTHFALELIPKLTASNYTNKRVPKTTPHQSIFFSLYFFTDNSLA